MKEAREDDVLKAISELTEQELSDWIESQPDKDEIEVFLLNTVNLFVNPDAE
jgi:hypothetical protein